MVDLFALAKLLLDSVIPVSAICLLGFFFGKKKLFSSADANVILKFVGIIAVPAISADIILSLNFYSIDIVLYSYYLLTEGFIYGVAFFVSRHFFEAGYHQAILIALASALSNHVLYVYPIALLEFQTPQIIPITTIMAMDILVLSFSIFLLDFGSLDRGSSTYSFLKRTIGNPPFLGLILGLIIINMPVQIPPAVPRMVDFISASAAPCALLLSECFYPLEFNELI